MLAIDLASNSTQLRLQLLILLDVLPAWHGYLDEHNFIAQFRVVVQKFIECLQLLRETLDMVESIDAHNDLDAFVLFFQGLDALLHLGFGEGIGELLRVDAHDELVCADESVLILDLICNLSLCSAGTAQSSVMSVEFTLLTLTVNSHRYQ